jgi:hypothetical protein
MTSNDKHDPIPLCDYFWHIPIDWEDRQKSFGDTTHDLMEQSGALSGESENPLLDLDCYDNFIFKHLEQLKIVAESANAKDDINPYQRDAEDLLAERLEFLSELAFNASLVEDVEKDVKYAFYQIEDNKDIFQRTAPNCKKLFDHFLHAQELLINFVIDHIDVSEDNGSTEDSGSADAGVPKN